MNASCSHEDAIGPPGGGFLTEQILKTVLRRLQIYRQSSLQQFIRRVLQHRVRLCELLFVALANPGSGRGNEVGRSRRANGMNTLREFGLLRAC